MDNFVSLSRPGKCVFANTSKEYCARCFSVGLHHPICNSQWFEELLKEQQIRNKGDLL